jgi:hypothetical protein
MTSSSYTSQSFLLGRSQQILGDAWRPKMFRKMPIPPGDWLAAPVVAELRKDLAIRWLAAKPDLKTVKRDTYKAECMQKFQITGRCYQFRVWPAARKLVGLPEHAKPGPKKQIKK